MILRICNLKEEIRKLVNEQFVDILPFNISIIDKNFNIIHANSNFENYFGSWQKKKCYEVYKKSDEPCKNCKTSDVFRFGKPIISNESGLDKTGKLCHYIVHLAPLKDKKGNVKFVIEMSTDVTETTQYQRNYDLLFEKVPSYVTIIDKNYKIVRANKKFRDTFGEAKGKYCYEVYKKRKSKCKRCPAFKTFQDGQDHFSSEIGMTFTGDETRYLVNTTALSKNEEGVQMVIEIASDITDIFDLQDTIRKSHDYYANLIENSDEAIIALNERNKTVIFNKAARTILKWTFRNKPVHNRLIQILPSAFFKIPKKNGIIAQLEETEVTDTDGQIIPVRFNALELRSSGEYLGKVAFFQDLREIKEMENQRIEAERLGAVGQTVAGLAHTIKNLLMGLEGGIYIVDTGLRQGDAVRIVEGWDILQRNFKKTTDLVKGFLSFAKGRLPELVPTNPNNIVKNIINLYSETARLQNVELTAKFGSSKKLFPLDSEGIEACITNLVSNAIDAAMMRKDDNGKVEISTNYKHSTLIIEVADNGCGMDSEVIQNIFTTFFTTKGNKGTGLGLLTVNKIIKEHGGSLEVSSELDEGSVFRIILPLKRLEEIKNKTNRKDKK